MKAVLNGVFCTTLFAVSVGANVPMAKSAEPPLDQSKPHGDYSNVPQSIKDLSVALKKLKIKIEIGIDYPTYKAEVANVCTDIRLFLESAESVKYPELRFLLSNTADCYLTARDLWGTSVKVDDVVKVHFGPILDAGQHVLWKVAAANVAGVNLLTDGTREVIATFIQRDLPNHRFTLTAEPAIDAMIKALVAEDSLIPIELLLPNELAERVRQKKGEKEKQAQEARQKIAEEMARHDDKRRVEMEKERKAAEDARWHTWTSTDGAHTVEAKFIGADATTVSMEKRDGTKLKVAKEKLSEDDLDWIRRQGWKKGIQ